MDITMLVDQWIFGSELTPTISVCMPVWNGSRFLERAFDCLAKQTLPSFEVILVDDGSQDDSADKARSLMAQHGLQGRVLRTLNQGCEQARDLACQFAQTDIIAPFDCDDYWEPEYLEKMSEALVSHPDIDLIYCDFVEENTRTGSENVKSHEATWVNLTRAAQNDDVFRFERGEFFGMLLEGQVLFPPCTMFKRSIYKRVEGYTDIAELKISLDWSFGLRVSRVGTVAFLNRPLLRKYFQGENVSADTVRTSSSSFKVVQKLMADTDLTPEQMKKLRTKGASLAGHLAYAMRTTHRDRWAALKWSLTSLRYRWNSKALKLALTTCLPQSVLDQRAS